MANSLNLAVVNDVTNIAQGDTASTLVLELLDEKRLRIRYLDKHQAKVYLVNNGEVKYEQQCKIFDSRLEINISEVLKPAEYVIEVHVDVDGFKYIFPSDVNYKLRISASNVVVV